MQIKEPGPHLDHMMRQTRNHHVQLSFMADSKANMLMTVASVVLTISVSYIKDPHLRWAAMCLMTFCFLTILLAIYAAMPKLPFSIKKKPFEELYSQRFNLLFFGDFIHLSFEDYQDAMEDVLNDPSRTYQVQLQELYNLGLFLANKKYRFLRMAYIAFITGLFLSGCVLYFDFLYI